MPKGKKASKDEKSTDKKAVAKKTSTKKHLFWAKNFKGCCGFAGSNCSYLRGI